MNVGRDANRLSAVMMSFGGALLIAGAVLLATLPPALDLPEVPRPDTSGFMEGRISIDEVGRRNREWFDENSRRSDEEFDRSTERSVRGFAGAGCLMLGAFLLLSGAGFSRRGRALSNALAAERVEAVARGARVGIAGGDDAESRLEKLADLHRRGLISDEDLAEKRREILASV